MEFQAVGSCRVTVTSHAAKLMTEKAMTIRSNASDERPLVAHPRSEEDAELGPPPGRRCGPQVSDAGMASAPVSKLEVTRTARDART
jgi:hypothetical protein